MSDEPSVVEDAILGLQLLQVATEGEARRILAMWARVGELSDAQIDTVVRAAVWLPKTEPL